MSSTAFTAAGFEVSWAALLVAVAGLQWLVMVSPTIFTRAPRTKRVLISSGIFMALWLVAFDGRALLGWKASATTAQAGTVAARAPRGSCSLITNDMADRDVEGHLGKPDEIRANEETRGPGAAIWIYRDSRCAVHVFDGKVEFIE